MLMMQIEERNISVLPLGVFGRRVNRHLHPLAHNQNKSHYQRGGTDLVWVGRWMYVHGPSPLRSCVRDGGCISTVPFTLVLREPGRFEVRLRGRKH